MSDERGLLRHALATLAYRASKATRGAPPSFAALRVGDSTRTPVQVIAHMGDLMDWALSMARGAQAWHDSEPLAWDAEVARLFAATSALDEVLASPAPLGANAEKIFQGPIADALTHVGQLTMLRRLGASPVKGENYAVAAIAAGQAGATQPAPRKEFD
ncbi:MAG: hypothetical protein ABJD07_11975 [Gemmatimonadaceae bacterium]